MPEPAHWAQMTPGGRDPSRVLGELDALVLRAHPGVRARVNARADAAVDAVRRAAAGRRPHRSASDELVAAATVAERLPAEESARLRAERAEALAILERRGVLAPEVVAEAAAAPLGASAAAVVVAGAVAPGSRPTSISRAGPAPAGPTRTFAADPGAGAGATLAGLPLLLAALVGLDVVGAVPAAWAATLSAVAGAALLAGTGGRGRARAPRADRLGARGLTALAVLSGTGAVASGAVALTDPETGAAVGAIVALQGMSAISIAALASLARRAARDRPGRGAPPAPA